MLKEFLSATGIVLTFVIFVPYIRSIRRGHTKPHAFSWLIWALGTLVVFGAQLVAGGGVGAWPIGVSGVITGYVALLAYRGRTDRSIHRSDWIFLAVALAALPSWLFTSNPLWAVVILTGADLAGFGPTFRSAYVRPHQERTGFYALAAARNAIVILALEAHSTTTVLFPAAVGVACLLLVAVILWRRRALAQPRPAVPSPAEPETTNGGSRSVLRELRRWALHVQRHPAPFHHHQVRPSVQTAGRMVSERRQMISTSSAGRRPVRCAVTRLV